MGLLDVLMFRIWKYGYVNLQYESMTDETRAEIVRYFNHHY